MSQLLEYSKTETKFDPAAYLATSGCGRKLVQYKAKQTLFVQGSEAASVFYLQSGRAKLTVVSDRGREAIITMLKAGDFIGEEAVAGVVGARMATATALTACVAMKIDRDALVAVLHDERTFSDLFMKFILERGIRTQEDLIDQLFNSSEKRLARTLLLMAEFGKSGEPGTLIPPITQEALADMIGTTRSRVSYFMNRFRRLGLIDYDGRIHVHKSLLKAVLQDQLPEQGSSKPKLVEPSPPRTADTRKVSKKEQNFR